MEEVRLQKYLAYIERLNFELNGLKSLTAQFMSDSPFKADLERFVMVKNEYLEKFKEYNLAQQLLIKTYAPDCAGRGYMHEFNFVSGEMSVYKM